MSGILALGAYVPERVMTNADFEAYLDTSDEWIVTRTGIKERRVAAEDEYTSDLAFKAVEDLLRRHPGALEGVDAVIVATNTPDALFPDTAALVQARFGLKAFAYDLLAGCPGWIYALAQAHALPLGAVVAREGGLRTARRISHCFIMDVPAIDRVVIITDAAINIFPTLQDKVHIVQNAIDMARALGLEQPKVAILSAMETVNPQVPSTLEAAALCKMPERGQITGALLDGPLALDNAINLSAAEIKSIDSSVAGRANVLIVPDLEAGNMLAKSLSFMAGAKAAGIVLGAKVPIILTSRADSELTRLASCAVAVMAADFRRGAAAKAVV